MQAGKKMKKKLEERQAVWEKIPGTGSGKNQKIVTGVGTVYHKPGSQNLRKH